MIRSAVVALTLFTAFPATAASCGDGAAGYEEWKSVMAKEARAEGVGKAGIAALMSTSYCKATIGADRNQKSLKYSLDKFMSVRGAAAIIPPRKNAKPWKPDTPVSVRSDRSAAC